MTKQFLVTVDNAHPALGSETLVDCLTHDGSWMTSPINVVEVHDHSRDGFLDDRHILYCGWVAGIALRNGLDVSIVHDDQGCVTPKLRIHLPLVDSQLETHGLVVVIPPPPDDWTFG